MGLFDAYSHYLAYLATDQETFRELRGDYDGVVVPGTIAAWQRLGTGGFVLSLSATEDAPPYVIDPRFPLFQQGLSKAKQSHVSLADLFGDSALVVAQDPVPTDFADGRLEQIAAGWARFNTEYGTAQNEKFSKYAARLNEELEPEKAQGPEAVLAPYFAVAGTDDPWWERSQRLFELTRAACAEHGAACLRVVCARDSAALDSLLQDIPDEQVAVWVSGLDETKAPVEDLTSYRAAIRAASERGQQLFAMYGGFFSVLLGLEGLRGAAHGVGFSEHRSWRELPESGAPPARYYLRRWHRYVSQDLAQLLWLGDPSLTECRCDYCGGRPPVALSYHELMKHSVKSRAEEIERFTDIGLSDAREVLDGERETLHSQVDQLAVPPAVKTRARTSLEHLPRWIDALSD